MGFKGIKFVNTVETLVSRHSGETVTVYNWLTGIVLIKGEFKQGFVMATVARAVSLQVCTLQRYLYLIPDCTFLVCFGGISGEFGRAKINYPW